MDIFDLRQKLIEDYASYIQGFIHIRHPRIREYVEQELFRDKILWPPPLVQINPAFQPGSTIDALVAEGVLHPAQAQIFRRNKEEDRPQGDLLHLHLHQEEAIRIARAGHSYVLTTGTGSGKSLSYIIPIADFVLRHPEKSGIKAIIVYPVNALANSQIGELRKYLEFGYPHAVRPIRFARYTGQEHRAERDEIIANPPDILLTNFVMLELMLTRLRERDLLNQTQLRFLVLDELHTYRGRQGADVSLLVRRARDRLTPPGETLQCVGTSATLAGDGSYEQQRQDVAAMASRIFGCPIYPEHVIGETLRRVTEERNESSPEFCQRLDDSLKDLLDIAGSHPTLALLEHVKVALRDPSARQRAQVRAQAMLQTLQDEFSNKNAAWHEDNWLTDVFATIEHSFEEACGRWRSLYRAAQAQRDIQHAVIQDASRPEKDKKQAQRLRSEAETQLNLLIGSNASYRAEFSDFYSYRYFASEGFLPGYNFPHLPLSVYIPARRSQHQDEYLSRPRFLAISEFAPNAIIYHEGSRYSINRSLLAVNENSTGILTTVAKLCVHCGYLHPIDNSASVDVCARCEKTLPAPLTSLFKLQNVVARRRDKISSDEEERLRQGYDIRTGIRFSQDPSAFTVALQQDEEPLATLIYGQAANIWRINFGFKRRRDRNMQGFVLDQERGYWSKDDESASDPDDPTSGKKMRVIPYVEDTRNCLLFQPHPPLDEQQMTSLRAALKNAIQILYQLEDNELAAEPLPSAEHCRLLLFYERTEGGAGVLHQLIDSPTAIASVAKEALRLCHFDPETGADLRRAERSLEDCEAACYYCLMNYANQREHRQLDRLAIKQYLQQLALYVASNSKS